VTGGWRKLHSEKLCNLYSSRNIIRNMKLRKMRWAWHVARMEERKRRRKRERFIGGKARGKETTMKTKMEMAG
jgi:hypothetical protein